MANWICPTCGCEIVGGGYAKDGIKYCCEPCSDPESVNKCCCHPVDEHHIHHEHK